MYQIDMQQGTGWHTLAEGFPTIEAAIEGAKRLATPDAPKSIVDLGQLYLAVCWPAGNGYLPITVYIHNQERGSHV